jgi:hypothetical protein
MAHTNDAMTDHYFGRGAMLNFPEFRYVEHFLVLEKMRVAIKTKEKEHLEVEAQIFDPLVVCHIMEEPNLLWENR